MKQLLILMGVVLAGLLPSGCGSSTSRSASQEGFAITDSAGLRTGVAGSVRMRPLKPVEEEGEAEWGPVPEATIVVEDESYTRLGRVRSDAEGKFYVSLPAGRLYHFRPQPFSGKMFPHPLEARQVYIPPEGGVVRVELVYDTGIR